MFGPLPVTGNIEMIEAFTRQFVVADFNNFFITDQAVLVHDATPPQPVAMRLPGLAAESTANQQ